MSLDQKALALAQAVGADIGSLLQDIGDLALLTTVQKQNLVSAINELKSTLAGVDLTAVINDISSANNVAWSADKIIASLNTTKQQILDGAPGAFDTLKEIADYLAGNDTSINTLLTDIGNTVRYDAAQTLTSEQQLQACINIDVNDYNVDLTSFYSVAKGYAPPPITGASSPEATGMSGNDFGFTASIPDGSSGGVNGNNFAF